MTALADDKPGRNKMGPSVQTLQLPVKAATKIYYGGHVMADSSGYAVPAASTAGASYLGVATASVDNSAGASGDLFVSVEVGQVEAFASSGLAITQTGQTVSALDDQTVTDAAAAGANPLHVGKLLKLDGSTAWVHVGVLGQTEA